MAAYKRGKGRSDNFQTPNWPVQSLLNVISEDLNGATVWDPCSGKGNIVKYLNSLGIRSFGTDITPEGGGINFLEDTLAGMDCIITNPPYSLKDEFLARCYALEVPFALLMPITALEGLKRLALYREHGLTLGLLPKRVNYETPSGQGKGAYFPSAWFIHGFGFEENTIVYL